MPSPTTSRSASTPGASSRTHSYNITKGRALLNGYRAHARARRREIAALPLLCRGAALRFLLTRLVDWLNVPPGALVKPKDPLEYSRKLRFHSRPTAARADYGAAERRQQAAASSICTDGACSRQSRSRRLGGDPGVGRARARNCAGGEAAHHQQPHGTDGRDHGAGSAQAPLRGRPSHRSASICATASPSGSSAGSATAGDRRPEAGQECRTVAAARCRRRAPQGRLALGAKAMPATTSTSAPTNSPAKPWTRSWPAAGRTRERT